MIERDTLDALELAPVTSHLASLAATPLGEALALASAPLPIAEALAGHRRYAEYVRLLEQGLDLTLTAPPDVPNLLTALAKEGMVLTGVELAGLGRLLDSAVAALAFLAGLDHEECPELRRLTLDLPALAGLARELARTVDDEGLVKDGASAALGSIRSRRRTLRGRLDRLVERFFEAHPEIAERIATERDDRTVVAVRSELRPGRLGLVHGRSSTGATLYVEPFELVAANNETVELRDEEQAEIERILRVLTARLAGALEELVAAAGLVGEVDFVRACARLARRFRSGPVALAGDGAIELVDARHPALVLARPETEAGLATVVPLSLTLASGETLVITGPNTGGKTVALKTIGLSALLFVCGLPIAARSARLPDLRSLRVDIGDPQDIAQSLSTFSGHLRNLGRALAAIELPALALLDALGAGTDPREGAALGVAIADRLRLAGVSAVITSHHEALKRYALSTPGVRGAAVEFDLATLRPTYRLLVDRTGSSNALVIAARLGIPEDVIAHARRLLAGEETEVERLLARLEMAARDHDAATASAGRAALDLAAEKDRLRGHEGDLERREAALREREGGVKAKLRAESEARLRAVIEEVRREGAELVLGLCEKAERKRLEDKLNRGLAKMAAEAAQEAGAAVGGGSEADAEESPGGAPVPGDRVRVRSFGVRGALVEIAGGFAVVAVGGKRLRVRPADLERLSAGSATAGGASPPPSRVELKVTDRSGMSSELSLIGLRVEEAIDRLDQFLDQASLAHLPEVRVIHGHGTGRLRAGVKSHLHGHKLVRNFEVEAHGGSTRVVLEA